MGHVVIAATHCFDQDLMDTVVKCNLNPIEKVERSLLIMANTIHQASIEDMTTPDNYSRISAATPELVEKLPAVCDGNSSIESTKQVTNSSIESTQPVFQPAFSAPPA